MRIGSGGAVDLVRLLHLLAMALFVGGQIFLLVAVVPVLRACGDRAGLRAVARRFGCGTVVAIAVLAATGLAVAARLDRWDNGLLHVKLALVGAVSVLVLCHMRWPRAHAIEGPTSERSSGDRLWVVRSDPDSAAGHRARAKQHPVSRSDRVPG